MLQKHSSARIGSWGNGIAAGKRRLAYLTTAKGGKRATVVGSI